MNTEYSLIKLLVDDPKQLIELSVNGFNSKYFKNPNYAQAYDLLYDRYTQFNSVPTTEEFNEINVEIRNEKIPHSLEHCLHLVYEEKRKELMRLAIVTASKQLSSNGSEAALDIFKASIQGLPNLGNNVHRSTQVSETTAEFMEGYHEKALNKGKMLGVPTGFPLIDAHVRGLRKQWFCVIQGRNGQYKSWILAKMIAHQFMMGKTIVLYSAEMSRQDFEERIYSICLNVLPLAMSYGELTSNEYNRLQEFLQDVEDGKYGKLFINDAPSSIDMVRMDVERLSQSNKIDIVCIDSAYRLQSKGGSTSDQYRYIAVTCKDIAKKHELPVLVTIQANRDFAKANSSGKKEIVASGASAYGSDGWNQEADIMWIVHRTPDHAPFHYSELAMDKIRHNAIMHTMLKINLAQPVIEEVDYEEARAKMSGENPEAQKKSDDIFAQTSEVYRLNDIQSIRDDDNDTLEEDQNA